MKRMILMTVPALLLLLGAGEPRAQQCKRITFERGQTVAVLKGEVSAVHPVCYNLRARNGQRLVAHLTSPGRRVRFSVAPDYFDADFLADAVDVTDWKGVLESPA